jgi:predicted DNA-binding WGR domain protein
LVVADAQRAALGMDWFADEDQAIAALIRLEAAKRFRGYWVEPQQLAML